MDHIGDAIPIGTSFFFSGLMLLEFQDAKETERHTYLLFFKPYVIFLIFIWHTNVPHRGHRFSSLGQ
jgi:hypothetical protein